MAGMISKCSFDGCERERVMRGFCRKHYWAARRAGKINVIHPKGLSLIEYMVRNSKLNPETNCIEWIGSLNVDGYGKLGVDLGKRSDKAHRASWELTYGEIPDGLSVLHKCDNRRCVNPGHLFLGTQADNVADRDAKGRQAFQKGELSGKAKLTEKEVKQILDDARFQKDIAVDYGVSRSTISAIKNRYNWSHVE